MNRIMNFRVGQLCDTIEDLHQRVRTVLASEIGLAVRDAVQDCLMAVTKKSPAQAKLSGNMKQQNTDQQLAMQIARVALCIGSWYLRRYGPLWSVVGILTASTISSRPGQSDK